MANIEDLESDTIVIKAKKSVLNRSITHHKLGVFTSVLSFGLLGLGCVGVADLSIHVYLGRVYTAGQNALGCKHRHASNQVNDIKEDKVMLTDVIIDDIADVLNSGSLS